jgi:hypothetical protein
MPESDLVSRTGLGKDLDPISTDYAATDADDFRVADNAPGDTPIEFIRRADQANPPIPESLPLAPAIHAQQQPGEALGNSHVISKAI